MYACHFDISCVTLIIGIFTLLQGKEASMMMVMVEKRIMILSLGVSFSSTFFFFYSIPFLFTLRVMAFILYSLLHETANAMLRDKKRMIAMIITIITRSIKKVHGITCIFISRNSFCCE